MGLCPNDLCLFETQSTVRGNYVTYQIVYIFLLSLLLLDIIYIYPNIPQYIAHFKTFEITELKCIDDKNSIDSQRDISIMRDLLNLQRLNRIFHLLYFLNFVYVNLTLFLFQLCQLDRKCCFNNDQNHHNNLKLKFKIRIIIRILFQVLIVTTLVLMGLKSSMIKRQVDLMVEIECSNTHTQVVQTNFQKDIYIPALICLSFFTLTLAIDNLLYFMKGFILQNLLWGSYHRVEEIETKTNNDKEKLNKSAVHEQRKQKAYSFGRQDSFTKTSINQSEDLFAQSQSPNFNIELAQSKRGSQNSNIE